MGKLTGCNENLMLECPCVGEPTGSSSTSTGAEVTQNPIGLLNGDESKQTKDGGHEKM